jgi:hypothetical protein
MKRNVIILTNGLAGSSVLAGLIADAGYWVGDGTFKKSDYDTYENQELIALNLRLFKEVGYQGNHAMVFRADDIREITEKAATIDPAPYRDFVERCNQHQPWIWKDPRLWLTIRFWKQFLDMDRVQFLFMTREHMQSWISTTIRRQIQTQAYCRAYMDGICNSILDFFRENELEHLDLVYEDLLTQPEQMIDRLNAYLGAGITMDNLKHIYRGPLYRKQRGFLDYIKANLIYFKNYSERYR